MNLPNVLTALRILLACVFIFLCYQDGLGPKVFALIIFSLASFTDFLDGHLARKYGLISTFGKIMDPVADKFLILSAFFIFMQMQYVAVWMFVLIGVREAAVTALRLHAMRRGVALAAEGSGKLKTVLQIIAVYLIIIYSIAQHVSVNTDVHHFLFNMVFLTMCVVVFMTLWSGILFIGNNRKAIFRV